MQALPIVALISAARPATAAGPGEIDLYSMLEHEGEPELDREVLGQSFRQLAMELGTLLANKPSLPAGTVGLSGFDLDVGPQFVLTGARDRLGLPSPWRRADPDEEESPYQVVPTLTVRKGLPLSTEVGASFGWIGGTSTGLFGGFARAAVLEGYKPLPDLSVQLGYSGYVGNGQLDCGALDLGATLGSTFPTGRIPGINVGSISPWVTFSTLRIRANPTVDPDVEQAIGALRYAGGGQPDEDVAPPIAIPRFGGGVEFASGNAHVRLSASWAPATVPAVSAGFGFGF